MDYQPSPIWKSFGAHSHEEFENKFVLKSRFHSGVHKEVVAAYDTIESLLHYAYYEYKFLDVALTQLMGLFEMAVKLRCEEIEIALDYQDRRDHLRKKNLNRLIDELVNETLTEEFHSLMHNVRKMRNYSAHPERNDTLGTLTLRPMLVIINLINQLFLSQEHHLENKKELDDIRKQISFKKKELFKLQTERGLILVYSPKLVDTFKVAESWIRVIYFEAVLENTKEQLSNHRYGNSIIRFFKDVSINDNGITAFDMDSNEALVIERTLKPKNIEYFNEHINELAELDLIDLHTYKHSKSNDIDVATQKFIYENCWN